MHKKIKNIGFVASRLGGLDGVSLEVDKWVRLLKLMGAKVYLCAGRIERPWQGYNQVTGLNYPELMEAKVIPELCLPYVQNGLREGKINRQAYRQQKIISDKFDEKVQRILRTLKLWIKKSSIDVLVVANINSLPVNMAAAAALALLAKQLPQKIIFHNHDFYWEREVGYWWCQYNKKFLMKDFLPSEKNIMHITINSLAQKELKRRNNIQSILVPNIFVMDVIKKDSYNKFFRQQIGIAKNDLIFWCQLGWWHVKILRRLLSW